jgi:hypothetical protein
LITLLGGVAAHGADAPDWMHALVNAPVPAHEERTDAVVLYSEVVLNVAPNGRIKRLERRALKILRPDGENRGRIQINFDAQTPIEKLRAWCIPASGKDFQVKDRDAVESVLPGVQNGELVSDIRAKFLRIPAATPGAIIGYEFEQEQKPYFMDDEWGFQDDIPVAEASYTLQLPAGWNYKSFWLNHAEVAPSNPAPGQWRWSISGAPAVAVERRMPPWRGVAARMVVALLPPGKTGLLSWKDVGDWHLSLLSDRLQSTPEISRKVAELTGSSGSLLEKIRALAFFVQTDIRYVAIELGIGGYQPHKAAEVFANRFGDCKDKAALLKVMLKEIGVDSDLVLINTVRGTVSPATPPNLAFNHAIAAIRLPRAPEFASLRAVVDHKSLGRILYFDPTDPLTPLGSLSGPLQGNYALLSTAGGSELLQLPQLPADANTLTRTARMQLDAQGALRGDIAEVYVGDLAAAERARLHAATVEAERLKALEARAAESLSTFALHNPTAVNATDNDKPFEWHYSLEADRYAKITADLMMVRPRVLGEWSNGFLETKDPRRQPIEFEGPQRMSETVEMSLPVGYSVDELPEPVDAEYKFASYHSKSEAVGGKIRYRRTLEIKQLSVPVADAGDVRNFNRIIFGDERRAAVLKHTGSP